MAGRKMDDYKPLGFYKKHTEAKQGGFSKFEVEGDYYFCRYSDGKICLISQAYTSVAGRDNGIVSVRTNEKINGRCRLEERDGGKHGFSLRAGNGQEVGVSPDYATLAAAEHVVGRLTGKIKAKKKTTEKPAPKIAASKASASEKPETKQPETKKVAPKKATAKKTPAKKTVAKTATVAVAASFTGSDARTENYKPLGFYETHGGMGDGFNRFDEGGAYYFNHAQDGEVVLISESYTSARGRDNGVASVEKNMKLESAYQHHVHENKKHYFDINAANHQEIATSRWYDSKGSALDGAKRLRGEMPLKSALAAAAGLTAGAALVARAANVEQDYKPLAFYQGQTDGLEHGAETFTGEDGKHYFAYFENDKIALISEGYPTKAARDTGVASVEKNIGLEKRYDYRGPLKNGKFDYRLKAGNGKEIARSVWYGSAAAALAGAAYLMGTRKRVPPVAPKPSIPIAAVAAAPIAAAAVLASAPKAAAMPVTKAEPVPPPVVPAAATPVEGGAGIWGWLKWLLLALIALFAMFFLFKACAGGDGDIKASAPVGTEIGSAAAAPLVACWNGSKAESRAACPTKITCWNGDEVASQSACPVEPPKTFTCWDESVVNDLANCPDVPKAEAAPAGKPKPAAKAIAASTTTAQPNSVRRVASANTGVVAGIFSTGVAPVIVKRLGTNPEFGDSRTLGASAFYDKLNNRYATNDFDRAYLDYLAGELGYSGWSDVTAADFTEATLANGTTGVLGYGDYHGYQYSKLDVTDATDLDAFQLASRNGRTVYFMKRCGNYFFPT